MTFSYLFMNILYIYRIKILTDNDLYYCTKN